MREDTSDFADKLLRISHYCTEKYDLSFQLTYHTLAFDFQTRNAEEQALFDMSKIQQTVVLDLQTSNILISALPSIDQLISKTFLLKTRGTAVSENTLHWRKIEVINAPLLI